MGTTATRHYPLTLTQEERDTLVDILQEVQKETLVEEHRTRSLAAQAVVGSREALIESLLEKVRRATPV